MSDRLPGSGQASLSTSDWFKQEDFQNADFDASTYVAQCTRLVRNQQLPCRPERDRLQWTPAWQHARPGTRTSIVTSQTSAATLLLSWQTRMLQQMSSEQPAPASSRVQVPIEMLQERLQLHQEQLRAELVDVINADYSEFMGLSEQFGDVDGAVLRIKVPLHKLQEELAAVQQQYDGELEALEQCLQRQAEVRRMHTNNHRWRESVHFAKTPASAQSAACQLLQQNQVPPGVARSVG